MTVTTSPEDIRGWVRERTGYYLERPAEEINTQKSLAAQGFDSMFALALCGDIEDAFGLEVNPTLAWDFPTVDGIAAHLSELLAQAS